MAKRAPRKERSYEQAQVAADFLESRGWRAKASRGGYTLKGPTDASITIFLPGPVAEGGIVGDISGGGRKWEIRTWNKKGESVWKEVPGDALNAAGAFLAVARHTGRDDRGLHFQYSGEEVDAETDRRGAFKKRGRKNPRKKNNGKTPTSSRKKNPSGVSLRSIMSKALK